MLSASCYGRVYPLYKSKERGNYLRRDGHKPSSPCHRAVHIWFQLRHPHTRQDDDIACDIYGSHNSASCHRSLRSAILEGSRVDSSAFSSRKRTVFGRGMGISDSSRYLGGNCERFVGGRRGPVCHSRNDRAEKSFHRVEGVAARFCRSGS